MIEESIPVFERLGYDRAEAQFLALAAIHSGYFVRRQYSDFLGQGRGGNAQRFIEKLLAKGHATFARFRLNKLVYHIRAKKIYNRLGQTDNRNRREKAPLTIKRKLMCLDFALAHRDQGFLQTELEKVAYFTGDRRILLSDLPMRRYTSHRSGKVTDRYFIDKLPIFVTRDSSSGARPVVHFAYIDEGAETLQGFETFLQQYSRLLSALEEFEIVYVATTRMWFAKAAAFFARSLGANACDSGGAANPDALELAKYFELRRKFEARDFKGLDADRIVRYREEKLRYHNAANEELYRHWLTEGERVFGGGNHTQKAVPRSFETMVIPHNYDIFGGIQRAC